MGAGRGLELTVATSKYIYMQIIKMLQMHAVYSKLLKTGKKKKRIESCYHMIFKCPALNKKM